MVKIRKATYKDQEFVKKLDKENMKKIIGSYNEKYQDNMFDSFKLSKCFIIEINGPVGFVYFSTTKSKVHILSMKVLKNYQRKEFGKKLMDCIVNFAKEKKLKKIILEAHDSNKKAINFYNKLGFKKTKIKKHKVAFEYEL